jgi:adenosylcobyric acid synthase
MTNLPDLFTRITSTNTPSLMFQGTCSNAGKSVLTAALCRILLQDGVSVAPFKSQNMSLNSFVTRDGGEMGRAQVVQAQACLLDPDVRMNPILLKPSSDTGSQVIIHGRAVANMSVEEYITYKPEAFRQAMTAYDSLAAEYDVIRPAMPNPKYCWWEILIGVVFLPPLSAPWKYSMTGSVT